MLENYIVPDELRAALKETDLYTGTKWIDIGGHSYFVHPKSPGGWRRIVHIVDQKTMWIIYYFSNLAVKDVASAQTSANSYFKGSILRSVHGHPDLYYVDPTNELAFSTEPRPAWEAKPKRIAFAVTKLQSLHGKLTPAGKAIYKNATLDITAQLLDNSKWVYDLETLKYSSMFNFYKFDLSSLGQGEILILIRALKEFFKDSADEIKTSMVNGLHTLIFSIEV